MRFAPPKDDRKYKWTHHVVRKMQYYGLTPSRVLRVVRAPQRVEEGVAEGTLAAMQVAGSKAHPWEIWVMWKEEKKNNGGRIKNHGIEPVIRHSLFASAQKVIITAWRYPGTSPVRSRVPIPREILAELEAEGLLSVA